MNARRTIRFAVPVGVMLIAAVIAACYSIRLHGSHHSSTWYVAVGLLVTICVFLLVLYLNKAEPNRPEGRLLYWTVIPISLFVVGQLIDLNEKPAEAYADFTGAMYGLAGLFAFPLTYGIIKIYILTVYPKSVNLPTMEA